jgi:hypothetical protein
VPLEEMEELIERYARYLRDVWLRIKEGNFDWDISVAFLELEEARYLIENRINALRKSVEKRAVIVLPLPPELTGTFCAVADGNVLSSDYELPPHLRYYPARHIDDLLPAEVREVFSEVDSVVFEGFFDQETFYVRRPVAKLLQTLDAKTLYFYVRSLPHRPPHHSDCVAFEPGGEVLII